MGEGLKTSLTVLVAVGWIINLCAPIFVHSYSSSLAANAPLLLILGSLFQARQSSKKKRDDDDE